MVVWQIQGDRVGRDDCGAAYYPTRAEALAAMRAYRKWLREQGECPRYVHLQRLVVRTREELCHALDDAMGFGGS